MGIVPLGRLVLDVRDRDRQPARLFLGCIVNLIIGQKLPPTLQRHHLGDRGRQRGLAMVHMPDRPYVHVGLGALKYRFAHTDLLSSAKSLPSGFPARASTSSTDANVNSIRIALNLANKRAATGTQTIHCSMPSIRRETSAGTGL